MTPMEALDAAAVNLSRAYAQCGNLCVVVRSHGPEVGVIAPEIGATVIATHLRKVADIVFDGPATIRHAGCT